MGGLETYVEGMYKGECSNTTYAVGWSLMEAGIIIVAAHLFHHGLEYARIDVQTYLLLLLASVHFLTAAHLSPPHPLSPPLFSPPLLSHCPILSLPH